jgi:hypothetical protein
MGRKPAEKQMEDFNNIIDQLDPISMYRTPYPTAAAHTLFFFQ